MDDHCRRDLYFMKLAIEEAKIGLRWGEVPIGAVIAKDDRCIARSHNTREIRKWATRHAEINAIEMASEYIGDWRLTGCTIYVTIEPCPMCAGAIAQSRLSRVVFGAADPKAGACGSIVNLFDFQGFNHYPEQTGGVLENECAELMRAFFRRKRKRKA